MTIERVDALEKNYEQVKSNMDKLTEAMYENNAVNAGLSANVANAVEKLCDVQSNIMRLGDKVDEISSAPIEIKNLTHRFNSIESKFEKLRESTSKNSNNHAKNNGAIEVFTKYLPHIAIGLMVSAAVLIDKIF